MTTRRIGERGLGWLVPRGHEAEIVLSTRVRLARNLQGFPFAVRAGRDERLEVLDRVRGAISSTEALTDWAIWEMSELNSSGRRLLRERHLVSRELVAEGENGETAAGAALVVDGGPEPLGMMVNEEDHLRLQTLRNGFVLEESWRSVNRLDEEIGRRVPYAFHHEFGFLTSCPTNVGTGLRASVLVHLPGLVLTKEIQKVLQGISQVGLTFRGFYGEGSEVVGNFFQLSNQTTLGKTEEELVDHLARIAGQVIEYEKEARSVLVREAPSVLEDKVWRAYGILRHARSLGFEELMNLLSGVRLGLALKLLSTPRVETLNSLMIFAQRAHLERAAGRSLDDTDASYLRSKRVREALAADEEGTAPDFPGRAKPDGPAEDDTDPPGATETDADDPAPSSG